MTAMQKCRLFVSKNCQASFMRIHFVATDTFLPNACPISDSHPKSSSTNASLCVRVVTTSPCVAKLQEKGTKIQATGEQGGRSSPDQNEN